AFEVFEDGDRQPITQFTRERVPVGLGVLLDISDSMFGRRIEDARTAVDRFLFDLLDPADEFFLMAFNHKPRAMTGWTRAQAEVQRALGNLQPSGGTAIYDGIVDSMPLLEGRTRPRGALLVISDGADTASAARCRGPDRQEGAERRNMGLEALALTLAIQVSARSRSIRPGELVVLTMVPPAGFERVQVRVFDRDVRAFRAGDREWQALVGI